VAAPTLGLVVDGVVAVAIIAAASTLCALGKIDGQTTIAVIGVAVTLIGGSAKALVALYAPSPSLPPVRPAAPPAT
jgi:hypothetical protein